MSLFPQIGAGSVAQFPLTRSRRWRAIANQLESTEQIMLPDTAAGEIGWRLSYQDLTDTEAGALSSLFASSQGSFGAFTFVDPMANLLGWSEDLSQPVWQAGLLQHASGVNDPLGTLRASSITNASPGAQTLTQTLALPGSYVACFSVYLRSDTAGSVTLQRDGTHVTAAVGPAWQRVFVSGAGTGEAVQSSFSISVAAAQTVDVWGLQVEVQPYPSAYRQTTAPLGIYEETYFENDELRIARVSPALSSCEIRLLSRVL
jgi:hypothetical protein